MKPSRPRVQVDDPLATPWLSTLVAAIMGLFVLARACAFPWMVPAH